MDFHYKQGTVAHNGEISLISQGTSLEFEARSDTGLVYHIITGKHRYGNYICIPNWDIGSELVGFDDRFWNYERLRKCTSLDEAHANVVVSALEELGRHIPQ